MRPRKITKNLCYSLNTVAEDVSPYHVQNHPAHEATLQDGRHVAVKVQRSGLNRMISKDIVALTYLMKLGEWIFPRLRALDLPVVVRKFANSLKRETDFSHEARSIEIFRAALSDVDLGCSCRTGGSCSCD